MILRKLSLTFSDLDKFGHFWTSPDLSRRVQNLDNFGQVRTPG